MRPHVGLSSRFDLICFLWLGLEITDLSIKYVIVKQLH